MFTRFGEAGRGRERRRWVALVSVGAHAAVVWLAAVATVRADNDTPPSAAPSEVHYVTPSTPPPPERRAAGAPPAPRPTRPAVPSAPALPAPIVVPTELPPLDPTAAPGALVIAEDLGAPRLLSGRTGVDSSGSAEPGGQPAGGVWEGATVEVAAVPRAGNAPPRYPALLEQTGVAGRVIARFVVDTTGRVEPGSVRIVATDHELFGAAVRRALAGYRFEPARVRQQRVRQLVEMPFVFEVRR